MLSTTIDFPKNSSMVQAQSQGCSLQFLGYAIRFRHVVHVDQESMLPELLASNFYPSRSTAQASYSMHFLARQFFQASVQMPSPSWKRNPSQLTLHHPTVDSKAEEYVHQLGRSHASGVGVILHAAFATAAMLIMVVIMVETGSKAHQLKPFSLRQGQTHAAFCTG